MNKLKRFCLNPKSGDEITTRFWTPVGWKVTTIKIGRKWASLKWFAGRKRVSLKTFKNHLWLHWRYLARLDSSNKAMELTGSYKKPKMWYKDYGFKSNPDHESVTSLSYKC
tara:strand:+ start:69 stop:401 length:333 start_codon:yes stop_codon:yes gene_type:complete